MATKRRGASSDEPKVDEKNVPPAPSKKSLRKAQLKKQQSQSVLFSPAIKILIAVLSSVLCIIITRPYWKADGLGAAAEEPARIRKEPVVIKNKENPGQIFQVVDLPGRGKGMLAARDIRAGELILKDKAIIRLPSHTEENPTEYVLNQIANLTESQLAKFMSLSYLPNLPEKHIPFSIMQTNAFAAGDSMAIFPEAARLNHACAGAFNTVYNWREEEETLYVHALRNIRAGEELLTTYIDSKKPRAERQKHLKENYHFDCDCPVCTLPVEQSKESDRRLTAMANLYVQLKAWNEQTLTGKEAIAIVNNIWKLGEEEHYVSERGQLAADAAIVATAHSDLEAASEWRALAAKWFAREIGEDTPQVFLNRKWANEPDSHPVFGRKAEEKVGGPSDIAKNSKL